MSVFGNHPSTSCAHELIESMLCCWISSIEGVNVKTSQWVPRTTEVLEVGVMRMVRVSRPVAWDMFGTLYIHPDNAPTFMQAVERAVEQAR